MDQIYLNRSGCRFFHGAPPGSCPWPERSAEMRIGWRHNTMDQFALEVSKRVFCQDLCTTHACCS